MGPFEAPVGDHRMVRNGLIQGKETENGQNGKEAGIGVTGVIEKNPRKEKKGEGNTELFLCWLTHFSPLSLHFVCFFWGGSLFQGETKQSTKSPMATQHTTGNCPHRVTDMNEHEHGTQ